MRNPIRYRIYPIHPEAHLFEVSVTVDEPDPAGQQFQLPAWVPGSYMIREFAKHVVGIAATRARKAVGIAKVDKHTWIVEPGSGPITVTMQVYAWDLSVRGAHLDTGHGFFNGPCVFLKALGHERRPCEVEIQQPRGARYRNWRVATAMKRRGAPAYGFGTYAATDYDELIDHPVEMGRFTLASFKAHGVPHDIAITGAHKTDADRLCRDLKRLCEWHIDLFGRPAPMDRYVFLVTAVGEGYGGLEHRASTALLCSRDDLPRAAMKDTTDEYRTFLGLCSHEYFHTWNVKRIKPAVFTPYDLARESYTSLLWAFEGITSYYDDLALVRTGLITQAQYLETLGRNITSLLRTPGRMRQNVAEASWDAWIKYYRQDENAPNALVSYYLKGSLVALCLDLLLRRRTRGRKSLDDVMRALWERHGRSGVGVLEDGVERTAEEIAGMRLRPFFNRALRSTAELPLRQLLGSVGVELDTRPAESASDRGGKKSSKAARELAQRVALGARSAEDPLGAKLTHVFEAGPAQKAGLSAGDVIVALDGLRTTGKNLDKRLARCMPGDVVQVHAFRRDELLLRSVTLLAAPADTCWLTAGGGANERRRRETWLAG